MLSDRTEGLGGPHRSLSDYGPVGRQGFAERSLPCSKQSSQRTQQHPIDNRHAKNQNLGVWEMFSGIAQHVRVPENLFVAKRELPHAVGAVMVKTRGWAIEDSRAAIKQSFAKIDILEPNRKEPFVEAANRIPRFAGDSQAGSGRLFDLLLLRIVGIEATIVLVHRIARPKLVYQQCLAEQRGKRWDPAEGEAACRLAVCLKQRSADGATMSGVDALEQSSDGSRLGDRIRVEDEKHLAFGLARGLIYRGAEATILLVGDQTDGVPSDERFDSLQCVILGSIVNDEDVAIFTRQGLQTGANGLAGVVGYDNGSATGHSLKEARIIIVGS